MARADQDMVLLYQKEIHDALEYLAGQVELDFGQREATDPLIALTVLGGGVIFSSDFLRVLQRRGVPLENKLVRASSYANTQVSSGQPHFEWSYNGPNLQQRDVLVLEDLVDSGLTLNHLVSALQYGHQVRSVTVLALLAKEKEALEIGAPLRTAFTIPDLWVYGYGIDSQGEHRGKPDLWAQIRSDEERMLVRNFRNAHGLR